MCIYPKSCWCRAVDTRSLDSAYYRSATTGSTTAPSSPSRSSRPGRCWGRSNTAGQSGSADGPMTLDELRESLRRILGVDVPLRAAERAGPACAAHGSTGRTRDRPTGTGQAGCCWSATPHTCTRRWAVRAEPRHAGCRQPRLEARRRGERLGADGLLDTYESERYPVGERVMMHSQAQLALVGAGTRSRTRCESFSPSWCSKPEVATHLAGLLAGLRRPL